MVDAQTIGVLVTAASVTVAAIYYVMNIRISQRNQELMLKSQETSAKTQELALKSQQQAAETRQAQLFMQVFNRYHEEEFWRIYNTVQSRDWKNYEDWDRDRSDPNFAPIRLSLGCYFEGIGVLVSRGLLSTELVADILGGTLVSYWNKQCEYIKGFRVRAEYPQYGEYSEYLYNEIMRIRGSGFSPKIEYGSTSSKVDAKGL
ncbi:MAG: hypothetical protein ABSA11_17365 [Candidatus Bathyarchaeia archaeon]|jgi:hypothetical protein